MTRVSRNRALLAKVPAGLEYAIRAGALDRTSAGDDARGDADDYIAVLVSGGALRRIFNADCRAQLQELEADRLKNCRADVCTAMI